MGRPFKEYNTAIIIGTFEPFELWHARQIELGLNIADTVVVLVGSAYNSTISYSEREMQIKEVFPNVNVEPLPDNLYAENQWITDVQEIVSPYIKYTTVLIGRDREYLKYFPQWKFKEFEEVLTNPCLDIAVPSAVYNSIVSIVLQSGHILLNKENNVFSLPNTYPTVNESLKERSISVLREDIKLKVPVPVLKGSIEKVKVFHRPTEIITHAYYYQLKNDETLPKVKSNANWYQLSDFYNRESEMFKDHYYIVRKMIDNE